MAIFEMRLRYKNDERPWQEIRPLFLRAKNIALYLEHLFEDNFCLEEVRYAQRGFCNGKYVRRTEYPRIEKRTTKGGDLFG